MKGGIPPLFKRVFHSKIFLVSIILLILFFGISFGRAFLREYALQKQIQNLQAEMHRLESEKLMSLNLLQYIESDAYVEKEIRGQLGLRKEGENVVVVEGGTSSTNTPSSSSVNQADVPQYAVSYKWWLYFFNKSQLYP